MRGLDCHIIAMLVVAFRSTALALEHEAPVREGVVGETVGFPTYVPAVCIFYLDIAYLPHLSTP